MAEGWDLLESLHITEDVFSFEPYNRGRDVLGFDCGDKGLNDFIHRPEEVADFQDDGLGATTLVYCHGQLVGFFTLYNSSLELKYVESKKLAKAFKKREKEIITNIPAIAIGRFAVDKRVQGKGVGRCMMRFIVGKALSQTDIAVRLLILQALPDAQPFYQRRGFWFTIEKDKERGKRNRTMYFDLEQVKDIA